MTPQFGSKLWVKHCWFRPHVLKCCSENVLNFAMCIICDYDYISVKLSYLKFQTRHHGMVRMLLWKTKKQWRWWWQLKQVGLVQPQHRRDPANDLVMAWSSDIRRGRHDACCRHVRSDDLQGRPEVLRVLQEEGQVVRARLQATEEEEQRQGRPAPDDVWQLQLHIQRTRRLLACQEQQRQCLPCPGQAWAHWNRGLLQFYWQFFYHLRVRYHECTLSVIAYYTHGALVYYTLPGVRVLHL